MINLTVTTITDRSVWNDTLRTLPYAHVLQTWEWGEFKRVTTGWQPIRLAFRRGSDVVAMASVGMRRAGPLKVMYVPKGPALAYDDPDLAAAVLDHLQTMARRQIAVWLKIDPDVIAATGVPGEADDQPNAAGTAITALLQSTGWQYSADQVQFRNTVVIDLTLGIDALVAGMNQSTRRKIRIAERDGVTIRDGSAADLETLYDLYKVTGERDQFLIRPPAYYQAAWRTFIEAGLAHPLIAEVDGQAVASVILFHFGRTCWYFYGASSNLHRDKMPNYLLQWRAIQWAKARGYTRYDLWGAPNQFNDSDSLWGVYQFKRGLRGEVVRHIGAWDYAPLPLLYTAYTRLMPRVIGWMRGRRKSSGTIAEDRK